MISRNFQNNYLYAYTEDFNYSALIVSEISISRKRFKEFLVPPTYTFGQIIIILKLDPTFLLLNIS